MKAGEGEREREARVNEVAGALVMRRNGFSESDICSIYGYSPPTMTLTEFERRFLVGKPAGTTP